MAASRTEGRRVRGKGKKTCGIKNTYSVKENIGGEQDRKKASQWEGEEELWN